MALEWPFETLVLLKPLALSDFLSTQQQDILRGSSHLDDGVDALEEETEVFFKQDKVTEDFAYMFLIICQYEYGLVCAKKIEYVGFNGSPDDSHGMYAFIYVNNVDIHIWKVVQHSV